MDSFRFFTQVASILFVFRIFHYKDISFVRWLIARWWGGRWGAFPSTEKITTVLPVVAISWRALWAQPGVEFRTVVHQQWL